MATRLHSKGQHYAEAVEARRVLVAGGYTLAFSAPGTPAKWVPVKKHDKRPALAIGRAPKARKPRWYIVPYPSNAHVTLTLNNQELSDGKEIDN